MTLAGLVYNQYQSYQIQKQQKLEELILEQQRIVAEQRAAQGDLPIQGLSEQGRKNLENHGTDLRSQVNSVNLKTSEMTSPSVSQFKCDGREHCSQMSSYEEALFLFVTAQILKWMATAMVFHVKVSFNEYKKHLQVLFIVSFHKIHKGF